MSDHEKTRLRRRADAAWHRWRLQHDAPPKYDLEAAMRMRARITTPPVTAPVPTATAAPKCGVVQWFSGGAVGTDEWASMQMGAATVLRVDVNPEYLEWSGDKAVLWKDRDKKSILERIRNHDYASGPFCLAANVRAGFHAPNVEYDVDVGTLRKCDKTHPKSDMNRILQAVRDALPHLKIVMVASPPCRMTSNANKETSLRDKRAFVKNIEMVLMQMRYALEFGKIDDLVVEESAKGHRDKEGRFVPGRDARRMLRALNCVDDPGEELFSVEKVDAGYDCGAPSTRKRCVFARKSTLACMPSSVEGNAPGFGHPLGITQNHGVLREVSCTWLPDTFAGAHTSERAKTQTGHVNCLYTEHKDVRKPTLVAIDPVERSLLVGCRANDPRLPRLLDMSRRAGRALTGITYCVQWYLSVLSAALAGVGVLDGQTGAERAFRAVERERSALHRPPLRSRRAKWHAFLADLKDGMSTEEYDRRTGNFFKTPAATRERLKNT